MLTREFDYYVPFVVRGELALNSKRRAIRVDSPQLGRRVARFGSGNRGLLSTTRRELAPVGRAAVGGRDRGTTCAPDSVVRRGGRRCVVSSGPNRSRFLRCAEKDRGRAGGAPRDRVSVQPDEKPRSSRPTSSERSRRLRSRARSRATSRPTIPVPVSPHRAAPVRRRRRPVAPPDASSLPTSNRFLEGLGAISGRKPAA